jgi:4a-hydroxytetrahydrobiopterin dehydratase
VGARNRL